MWISPSHLVKTLIDFVLAKIRSIIKQFDVTGNIESYTDHKVVNSRNKQSRRRP